MVEICGKLKTYKTSSEDEASFTINVADFSSAYAGAKLYCVGNLPHFAKYTPLVLSGELNASDEFVISDYRIDTSPTSLANFLIDSKILSVKRASLVVANYSADYLFNMQDKSILHMVSDGFVSLPQAESVRAIFQEYSGIKRLWDSMQIMGLSTTQIDSLFMRYGLQTAAEVSKAPYKCGYFANLDLKTCDILAVSADSKYPYNLPLYSGNCSARMQYIIKKAAEKVEESGNCFVSTAELERILNKCSADGLFGAPDPDLLLSYALVSTVFAPIAHSDELCIYLSSYLQMEDDVALQINRLIQFEQKPLAVSDKMIKKYDDGQQDAIRGCLGTSSISIITGGPGTGKTTVLREVVNALEDSGLSVALAAPTGRAAARAKESTKHHASTLHRLLGMRVISESLPKAEFNLENPLNYDVVVVDESSMISLDLTRALLRAIKDGGRVIFVGDINQLPSVSPGRVLADLIESECIPTYRLTTVHRQKTGSSIVDNAYAVLSSTWANCENFIYDQYFRVEKLNSCEEVSARVLQLFTKQYDFRKPYNFQILCASKKGEIGKDMINQEIVSSLPGRLKGKGGYSKYDKVMTIHNNYDSETSYMNGDIGIVKEISDVGIFMTGTEKNSVLVEKMDDLDYAYASTVHKAQGSEYEHVVIVLDEEYPSLLYKGLLYTAITRAKRDVTILYIGDALHTAICKSSPIRRSGLKEKIQKRMQEKKVAENKTSEKAA